LKKEKRFTIVSASDFHVPFQCDNIISIWLKFISYIKPNILILHEVIDFYQLSRFDKDPKRINDLQFDLDCAHQLLKQIRKAVGNKCRIIMVESNHDTRLTRFIRTNSPELESLRGMKFTELMRLKELKIEYRKEIMIRGILFKHGDIIRNKSGYTATAEMDRTGCTGFTGHSHRLSQVYKRLQGGFFCWIEDGAMCQLNPEYTNHPDWQQGFAVIQFINNSKHFYATTVPIIGNKILWGSMTFTNGK
jgi:hypothetical protein